ncbi:IclR family transcriptional regulator C-terminal domain-containing protein [Streptomyces sp. NPDC090442]|uniref:IclR family transcriptional regulator domain-containing protein n=1 Tax=Streptomyces sp. NPDC090442 TaxID=3365962 RepID=UPI0038201D0F
MSIDRALRSAVEAVGELWSDDDRNAERYRQFTASLRHRRLERPAEALHSLRDRVDGALYLAVYEEGEVRVRAQSSGPATPTLNEWVDFRHSAHAHSFGKALLAQLDEDGLRDHISRHRLARFTSRTITGEEALRRKLREASPPGAPSSFLDLGEYFVGWVSAAVPVSGAGRPAALAVYLPLEKAHLLRIAPYVLAEAAAKQQSAFVALLTGEHSPEELADLDWTSDEAVIAARYAIGSNRDGAMHSR